jgi:hypothetical protein
MTIYPAQIDTSQSLPTVVDNLTPVQGLVFNRLRDAVLAIESELGIKPSNIYSTVRARLDATDTTINTLNSITVKLGGDIGGTVDVPRIIKLQDNFVSSATPTTNQFFKWGGLSWGPGYIDSIWGRNIDNSAPSVGQMYKWDGSQWTPSDVTGAGLIFSGGLYNVGQNADNTVVVNADDIQLNPSFYSIYAVPVTLVQRDVDGKIQLSDTDGGTVTTYGQNISQGTIFTPSTFGDSLTIQAQNSLGTLGIGGSLYLKAGDGTINSGSVNIVATGSNASINLQSHLIEAGSDIDGVVITPPGNETDSFTGGQLVLEGQNCTGLLSIGGDVLVSSGFGIFQYGGVTINSRDTKIILYSGPDGYDVGSITMQSPGNNSHISLEAVNIRFGTILDDVFLTMPSNPLDSITGNLLTLSGQSVEGTSSIGGSVLILGGFADIAGGDVKIQGGFGGTYGNVGIGTNTISAGGGSGVLFISQDAVNPTTNPVGGIILYVDSSGNLKARTSAGNIRTIAAV